MTKRRIEELLTLGDVQDLSLVLNKKNFTLIPNGDLSGISVHVPKNYTSVAQVESEVLKSLNLYQTQFQPNVSLMTSRVREFEEHYDVELSAIYKNRN